MATFAHADPRTDNHDEFVARALAKWPSVPACYGWLGLSGRGDWLLQGAPIAHAGLRDFLSRHYQADTRGCWFVQNGPQRVYVELELAPWIFRLDGGHRLTTHTGHLVARLDSLIVTDAAQIFMLTEFGFGALSDRDLAQFLTDCQYPLDTLASGEVLAPLLELSLGRAASFALEWRAQRMNCRYVAARDLEREFGFQCRPPAAGPA